MKDILMPLADLGCLELFVNFLGDKSLQTIKLEFPYEDLQQLKFFWILELNYY